MVCYRVVPGNVDCGVVGVVSVVVVVGSVVVCGVVWLM